MKATFGQNLLRIILGLFMTTAGIGHLTFQRDEFQAQVPSFLPDNEFFIDFVVFIFGCGGDFIWIKSFVCGQI